MVHENPARQAAVGVCAMADVLSRRDLLRLAIVSVGAWALRPFLRRFPLAEFPNYPRLGRNATRGIIEVKARPDADSPTLRRLYEDAVVPWVREVVGRNPYRINQRFVDIGDGYIWAPYLQPVRNEPQKPLTELPQFGETPGAWVQVSVPYVDLILANPPARSPWWKETPHQRLYYGQIVWLRQIKTDDQGRVWYLLDERHGTYGELFWAPAEAFRLLTPEDMAPISPHVEDKRIVVNVTYQTLSAYEGKSEVFFARVSTGAKFDAEGNPVDKWATPVGTFPIWRKLVTLHMSGGTTGGGWDLPAIPWVCLFVGSGVAIHGTYWHNNFGVPMSHGCVNMTIEDARWIFRWTVPHVSYDPGDRTVSMPGGTRVEVLEM